MSKCIVTLYIADPVLNAAETSDHTITCNDLSASAFAILGTLNDSWEIQKLKGKKENKGKISKMWKIITLLL